MPSVLELMDGSTIRAVEAWKPLGLDTSATAMLLLQSDVGGSAAGEELARAATILRERGASDVMESETPAEAATLLQARRLALPALERTGTVLLDDVAVPCTRIPQLLTQVEEIGRREGVVVATFGHAGDGNMHPTIVFDGLDDGSRSAAMRAFDTIVVAALELGGTVSGEHGVGVLKRGYLERELGPALQVQRQIKTTLDPLGILNPGKAI